MKHLFPIFLFISTCFSQEFPLINQTWLLINGGHKNIVSSILEFDPLQVIVITFIDRGNATYRYANISEGYYRSTSEAIDEIYQQLGKNKVLNENESGEVYKFSYQSFPDVEYSCNKELSRVQAGGGFQSYVMGDRSYTTVPSSDIWFQEEPVCYAERIYKTADKSKLSCFNEWCGDQDKANDGTINGKVLCNKSLGKCRYFVEDFEEKESSAKFWNLHVFPKIVWNPVHPVNHRVMTEHEFSQSEMEVKRHKAIEYAKTGKNEIGETPRNAQGFGEDELGVPWMAYLNPQYNKEKSVTFSGQFVLSGFVQPHQIEELNFNIGGGDENSSSFFHNPPTAYRLSGPNAPKDELIKKLILPFATDDNREWVQDLNMNCPGWPEKDRRIGELAFEVREDLTVRVDEPIPERPTDPSWYTYEQTFEKDSVTGNVKPKFTRKILEHYENPQTGIVRKENFIYSDYWWKGCPDLPVKNTLTKKMIRGILFTRVPKCDPSKFRLYQIALEFVASTVFYSPKDSVEKKMALKRAEQAYYYNQKFGSIPPSNGRYCEETPMDLLLTEFLDISRIFRLADMLGLDKLKGMTKP